VRQCQSRSSRQRAFPTHVRALLPHRVDELDDVHLFGEVAVEAADQPRMNRTSRQNDGALLRSVTSRSFAHPDVQQSARRLSAWEPAKARMRFGS
jgi:hypothetical protein